MKRTDEFVADGASAAFIDALNQLVARGEDHTQPERLRQVPLVLILGAPRSGTTLLLQWMNRAGIAAPTNLAARFWKTPYFAGMLQRLLTDPALNYRQELSVAPQDEFTSTYGKTSGILSPHEFSFFIRRFFPVTVGERLTDAQRAGADVDGFLRGVNLFGTALGQAVAMKGLLLQYELNFFRNTPQILLVHVHRDEADNVCSLLRHRERVAGDPDEWISVRPPEYDWLKTRSPIEQVAGQVSFTNAWIRRQLADFPAGRSLSIAHEDFCRNPIALYRQLDAFMAARGFPSLGPYEGPAHFEVTAYNAAAPEMQNARAALDRVRSLPPT